jgi:hypothetical protein
LGVRGQTLPKRNARPMILRSHAGPRNPADPGKLKEMAISRALTEIR